MGHEQSITVKDRRGKKWINVYGEKVPFKSASDELRSHPRPLAVKFSFEKGEYETVEEAEKAARRRSRAHGR